MNLRLYKSLTDGCGCFVDTFLDDLDSDNDLGMVADVANEVAVVANEVADVANEVAVVANEVADDANEVADDANITFLCVVHQ